MVLATMFCIVPVRGDDPPAKKEIPIKKLDKSDNVRSMHDLYAFYDRMLSAICTTVTSDIGHIEVSVSNLTTGESWYDYFDSRVITQTLLSISGNSGYYKVTYISEDGNIYEGDFVIE